MAWRLDAVVEATNTPVQYTYLDLELAEKGKAKMENGGGYLNVTLREVLDPSFAPVPVVHPLLQQTER